MDQALSRQPWRASAHQLLNREEGGAGRLLRATLVGAILVSVAAAIVKSVPSIDREHGLALDVILLLTTLVFALEFLVRVWIAPEDASEQGATRARLRYVFSAPGLIDLVAGIPFALGPHFGLHIDWLDIVPIFKLLRHTEAFQFLAEAIYSERRVLGSAGVLLFALLVFLSSVVYHFEREAQPDKFSSIPDAMWWGIITLATVGYGDVTPVTALGKLTGGITAVLGLCMFAIPIGIIASAFIEAARRREFVVTWNLVANVPMFRHLDAARIASLAGVLRARQAERGETLVRKGDAADAMFFVVSGEVEVDPHTGTRPVRLGGGEFFGEIALLEDRPRTASVMAATPCKLLTLHKRDFDRFMAGHPELAESVRAAAARRLAASDVG